MKTQPYRVSPETERELARRLADADGGNDAVVVEIAGSRYQLIPVDDIQTTDEPDAHFDPDKVLAAIEAGAGAFSGMNVDAFLADMYEAREQDTPGRSV